MVIRALNDLELRAKRDRKPWLPLFSQREASPRIAIPYLRLSRAAQS